MNSGMVCWVSLKHHYVESNFFDTNLRRVITHSSLQHSSFETLNKLTDLAGNNDYITTEII